MKLNIALLRLISGTLLISGTMIGAGMLGIPLITAKSGFFPGIIMTTAVWFFMYCTGLLLLEVTLWMPDGSNVLSISRFFFGKAGRFVSGIMFVFLYYSLMIAYFSAGAPLLGEALGFSPTDWKAFTLFGLLFGTIVGISPKSVDRANIILSIAMIVSWVMLVNEGKSDVRTFRLTYSNWPPMIFVMPILFSAFGFHNIIPSLCTYLKRDRKILRSAIFWGSILPLGVYIIWQWLIIGSISRDNILGTIENGKAVTSVFVSSTGEKHFALIGKFFAFFAVVTSTLGVSFSMVDFLGDGLHISKRSGLKRAGLTLLTFTPPYVLVLLKPDIFLTALGLAGGFGEAFLNGLLPIGALWVGKYTKKLNTSLKWLEKKRVLTFLTIYAFCVILIEIYCLTT